MITLSSRIISKPRWFADLYFGDLLFTEYNDMKTELREFLQQSADQGKVKTFYMISSF